MKFALRATQKEVMRYLQEFAELPDEAAEPSDEDDVIHVLVAAPSDPVVVDVGDGKFEVIEPYGGHFYELVTFLNVTSTPGGSEVEMDVAVRTPSGRLSRPPYVQQLARDEDHTMRDWFVQLDSYISKQVQRAGHGLE